MYLQSIKMLVCACVVVGSAAATPALAQALTRSGAPGAGLPSAMPKDIADAIKNAVNVKDVLPIAGSESFAQQIIKADEIVFDRGARMVFTSLSSPWVAIVAKKIKFRYPLDYSFIQRDFSLVEAPDGATGAAGPNGANRPGETNRRGNDGDPGGPGLPGKPGASVALPTLYIVAGQLIDDKNAEIPPGILNLAVLIPGVNGGDGGRGGPGGNGGNAGDGKEGATSAFDCKEGPGPGGDGGQAGQGGRGGAAGSGGNGGSLVVLSLKNGADTFTFARVNNQPGFPGTPGIGGAPGQPGQPGRGAGRNGWCGPSRGGNPGTYPSPINLGPGAPGADGVKGDMIVVTIDDLGNFFK